MIARLARTWAPLLISLGSLAAIGVFRSTSSVAPTRYEPVDVVAWVGERPILRGDVERRRYKNHRGPS